MKTAPLLTPRQRDVLTCRATGLTNRETADVLLISCRTVEHHVAAIYDTLEVRNIVQALRKGRELHLIPRD